MTDIESQYNNIIAKITALKNIDPANQDAIQAAIEEINRDIASLNSSIALAMAFQSYTEQSQMLAESTDNVDNVAYNILTNKLDAITTETDIIEQEKINASRQIQINTYYTNMYNAYISLMKINCIAFICIIILSILFKKNALPGVIYNILVILVILVDVYITGSRLIDFSNRSTYNWDEYQWSFDRSSAPVAPTTTTV